MRNPTCELCALHATCKTVCLWGEGPKDARVVVVGQNPGQQEDRAERPFINALLGDAGLDRASDVYVTNAVKCATPANRKPSAAEAKKCREYLDRELDSLRPKVIITLGDTALKAVTGLTGVTKRRGQFLERGGVPVIATFHPAYALKNGGSPQIIEQMKTDFLRAATFVNPPLVRNLAWEYGNAETDPHDYKTPIWAYDIETNGREFNDPLFKIIMLGIDDGTRRVVYPEKLVGLGYKRMFNAYHKYNVRLWGHNSIGFDAEALAHVFGAYVPSDDTMILAHIVDENAPLSLEAQACTQLGVPNWKQQVTWEWDSMSDLDVERCATYNAEDIANTRDLAIALIGKAHSQGLDRAYEITKQATIVFDHHVNHQGIALDLPRARTLKDKLRATALDAALKFEQIVGHPVNLGSPQQVAKALYTELGFTPVRYTDTGAPSTDKYSIKTLKLAESFGGPQDRAAQALDALLTCRTNDKLASMIDAYETKCNADGRLYFETKTWTTVTGRTTANQGFQQFPHDPRVRGLLTATPGNVLIEADYAQLQMRLAAEVSRSPKMMQVFHDGIDPHTLLASRLVGKPMEDVTKEERYFAKPCNFGLLFGAEPYTLRKQALEDYDLVIPEGDARRAHDIFHETYELEPYYAATAKELREHGFVRDPLGGIRHLPNIYANDQKLREEALRQAINYKIQRFEVYLAFLALWGVYCAGLRIVAFLHDAIYVECRADQSEHTQAVLRRIMVEGVPAVLASRYDYRLAIPLDVDLKVRAAV